MLNWIVYIKIDWALNNQQMLICHKTQQNNYFLLMRRVGKYILL